MKGLHMHNHDSSATMSGKMEYLDGIRGLMAFNVLLCHFVCVYYPQMYFQEYADSLGGLLSLFSSTPLSVLINGNIAVQYFFVLTGFLAGRSFFTKQIPAHTLPTRSVQRYLRLLPVVFTATVFTFLTMRLGLQYHLRIGDLVLNQCFLKDYCNFTERLIGLPKEIFLNPFIGEGSSYIGPFWTIYYELWGYIFSMALCLVFRERKYRRLEYLVVMVVLKQLSGLSHYIPFVMGVLVADLQFNRAPSFRLRFDVSQKTWGKWGLLLLGSYLATCPMYFTSIHAVLGKIPGINTSFVRAAGVAILLFLLLKAPGMQKRLQHPILLWMGELSFEVYAFHWPLLLSFQSWVFYRLMERFSYDIAAVGSFLLMLPVTYLTAYLVHIFLAGCSVFCARMKRKL